MEEILLAGSYLPDSISPDGRLLLYQGVDAATRRNDLWILPDPLGHPGEAKPYLFLHSQFNAQEGQFSPDGRWIAYSSDESGRFEVYATPFPGPGGKRQISTAGGSNSRWRGDGKEIFYLSPDGQLMTAELSARNGALEIGQIQTMFGLVRPQYLGSVYDISADGRRILAVTPQRNASEGMTIMQNWTAGLKR